MFVKLLVLLSLALCALVVCQASRQRVRPSPIILVPGLMGSKLSVKDDNPRCKTNSPGYVPLWISLRNIFRLKCMRDELMLSFNPETNSFSNKTGVQVTVPRFGNTRSVENIVKLFFGYMKKTIRFFLKRGYKRGKNIAAAPYDWRLAADELEKRGYFHNFKALVEKLYRRNGNTKVTLVAHSMGGIVSLHFLTGFNGIDQAWKDKHIHAFVPISGAWSGAVTALEVMISGLYNVKWLPSKKIYRRIGHFIAPLARSFESIFWLLPKPSVFKNQVLISTPSRNYTAHDYKQLFKDINFENGYKHFLRVQDLNSNYLAPNVSVHCFYGNSSDQTPVRYDYDRDFSRGVDTMGLRPNITRGYGDGTVNSVSCSVCRQWSAMKPEYQFKSRVFDGVDHSNIIYNKKVLYQIAEIVGARKKRRGNIFRKIGNFLKKIG